MSGFFSKRRLLAAAIIAFVGGGGTGTFLLGQGNVPPLPSGPATMPAGDKPIAVINGREINNAAFYRLLMQVTGMRVFQQVFDLTLVQRACSDAGIAMSGGDFEARVQAELKRTLDGIGTPPGTKEEDKYKILDDLLRQRNITAVEFRMGLERSVGLRALARGKPELDVTPTEIQDAYDAQYGERITAHVFNVGNTANASKLRDAIQKEKKTPEQAAAAVGVLTPNIMTISKTAKGNGIEPLRDHLFLATNKEGDLTASLDWNGQLLVFLIDKKETDRRPANPKANVEKQLEKEVANLKETNWMNNHLARLRSEAKVEINDETLLSQFKMIEEQMRAAAAQAASQPGGAPTTGPASPAAAPAATTPGGILSPGPAMPGRGR